MARKNPDKAKDAFKRLSSEILKYGEEGHDDLRDLFEVHKPEVIFKLEQGPERQARAAQLIGEMRTLSSELARAKYIRDRDDRKEKPVRRRTSKSKREVSGTHDRFKYVLVEHPDGKWSAKITRQGRQIIPSPGAPAIVDSPALKRPFRDQASAEIAVRRVINTALIWYDERGITPREKVRRTKSVRSGVQRRTAGQRAAMERAASERSAADAEERRRQKIRDRRRKEKVAKAERQRRPADPDAPKRGRKIVYIPRKNPSNPFSFSHSDSSAARQGEKSFERYKKWRGKWEDSLKEDRPNFTYVMKAYDHAENARANFTLAEECRKAEKAEAILKDLRTNIIDIFKLCNREMRKRRPNPSIPDHQDIANSYMDRADKAWGKYCDSCSMTDLLNSLQHLSVAREEYQHAGDKEGVANAKARIKLARQEIRKQNKG